MRDRFEVELKLRDIVDLIKTNRVTFCEITDQEGVSLWPDVRIGDDGTANFVSLRLKGSRMIKVVLNLHESAEVVTDKDGD